MRTLLGRTAAAVAVSITVIALANPAHADHGGSLPGPDNDKQAFKNSGLTSKGVTAMNHGKAQLERSNITTSWGGGDLYVKDAKYGDTGWYGKVQCREINSNGCDIYEVMFNETLMASRSLNDWKSLGCHEIGHTGSLGHRSASNDTDNNSCLRVEIWPLNLDAHDVNEINKHIP